MNEPTNGYAVLAEATLDAIDARDRVVMNVPWSDRVFAADRERVGSDLAGLREHNPMECALCHQHHRGWAQACPDALRYAEGLRRTAALYGVSASAEEHAHG